MMMTVKYKIEFFSHWHMGSGLAGSTYADPIVSKNDRGLPIIPGKTIKGLLRDAADQLHYFHQEIVSTPFIKKVFGTKSDEVGVDYTHEAQSFFTNAQLSVNLSEQIISKGYQDSL